MLEKIADAIEHEDYASADRWVQQLQQEEPDNPWIEFYLARLQEASGHFPEADIAYRQLLRQTTNPKILSQTRQSIERLSQLERDTREKSLARSTAAPGSKASGVLVLESVPSEIKQGAAQKLARVMQIDAYSARLQIPSRSWRLYRTGAIGELQFYESALKQEEIPCFAASIEAINQIQVYPVKYFQSVAPQVTAICHSRSEPVRELSFDWLEVTQRVEGLLPLFEECVELDAKRQVQRKTKTLDYVKFCDLHLCQRNTILRLWDRNYQFQQGALLAPVKATTSDKWNHLIQFLQQQLPDVPVWSEFTAFAETAIDFGETLKSIETHIDLLRREETPWDAAFQLYSSLIFLQSQSSDRSPK